MDKCVRCDVSEEEEILYDAIYDGRPELICERCAIIENIGIIKKPNKNQIKESEKPRNVYERMKIISGIADEHSRAVLSREQRLREAERNKGPLKKEFELIDYYHWEIMKQRRKKGLSQKQLAEILGIPVIVIEELEKAKLPEKNKEDLIRRLENLFQVRLKKVNELELIERMKSSMNHSKPVLRDEYGNVLDKIPEPEIEVVEEEKAENEEDEIVNGVKIKKHIIVNDEGSLDLNKTNWDNVTINDLRDLHRKKVEVTKQEQREEQKRIEARQRVIEAKKEEIGRNKEEAHDYHRLLGGAELLKKDEIEETEENL